MAATGTVVAPRGTNNGLGWLTSRHERIPLKPGDAGAAIMTQTNMADKPSGRFRRIHNGGAELVILSGGAEACGRLDNGR